MAAIGIYKDNPTAGGTDGTAVSSGGTYTNPVHFDLNALSKLVEIQKLAIRTESGYVTNGTTTISDDNDTGDRLQLCWTESGEYADSISTDAAIGNDNVVFYAKARCSTPEYSRLDRTARFVVSCKIVQV